MLDMHSSPAVSAEKCTTFRTVDYLFLFDPYMNLSQRMGNEPDEHKLTSDDYQEMKIINRMLVTGLVSDTDEVSVSVAVTKFSERNTFNFEEETGFWDDDVLDEELKSLILQSAKAGEYLTLDVVAHLEYFYNTLACDVKTNNPFASPAAYPALMVVRNGKTLFQRHREIIFPQLPGSSQNMSSGIGSTEEATVQDQKEANWVLPGKY